MRAAMHEAADEIERLEAALKAIAEEEPTYEVGGYSCEANRIATEALSYQQNTKRGDE